MKYIKFLSLKKELKSAREIFYLPFSKKRMKKPVNFKIIVT